MAEATTESLGIARESSPALPVARPKVGFFRRRGVWVGAFLALIGIAVVIVRAGASGGGKEGNALTAKVKRGDLEVVVLETGKVEPLLQTQIKSKVGGQVTEVLVQEGERVDKGQVLVRIDPTDYKRDVMRATADTAQAREAVRYARLRLGQAEQARKVAIAPAVELDQARHEAALAAARLLAAEVALETSRDRLRYTAIDAPFAGTIIQRNIQPGEVVIHGVTATVEGRPQLVLADMSVLLVKTELNQIDIARVKKGQKAEVTLDALPGKKFVAEVTRVAPAATNVNGRELFPVEAALENAQDLSEIKPGMTADVKVMIETRPKVLLVPIEAVVSESGKDRVHLVDRAGGKLTSTLVEVKLGARNDREVEVKSGISEGAEVMIKPPAVKNEGEAEAS